YLGIYFWNYGSQELRLYKRTAGTWTQLGTSYSSGPLPAGTKLTLIATGSRISFQQDGVERIAVTDTTLTGRAPAIITFGTAKAGHGPGRSPGAPDTRPPSAPGPLTATASGPTQITLSWGAAPDNVAVTGYRIERCQGSGCSNFPQIAAPTGTATTYNDTG